MHRPGDGAVSERALITGGGGFIGMHLARALAEKGYEVVVADSFARAVKDRALADLVDRFGVRIADTDLLVADNALALGRDFAVIYHLAAIIGVRPWPPPTMTSKPHWPPWRRSRKPMS